MLLNKLQKARFIEIYDKTSMPDLMKEYGTNNRDIIGMAKALGIYKTKIGKFKTKEI